MHTRIFQQHLSTRAVLSSQAGRDARSRKNQWALRPLCSQSQLSLQHGACQTVLLKKKIDTAEHLSYTRHKHEQWQKR
jgi:hypothetical protein